MVNEVTDNFVNIYSYHLNNKKIFITVRLRKLLQKGQIYLNVKNNLFCMKLVFYSESKGEEFSLFEGGGMQHEQQT